MKKINYEIMQAMAHKTRLDIMRMLGDGRSMSVGAIMKKTDCEPTLLRNHSTNRSRPVRKSVDGRYPSSR